jgi:hypothetical protein
MSMPAIMPYQDPEYGERPTYDYSEQESKDEQELAQHQDEVMTDVYRAEEEEVEGEENRAPTMGMEEQEG